MSFGQATVFWDRNGNTAGAGATPTGTWSTGAANWSTSSAGTSATANWTNGNNAVFSAGSDATGAFAVTATGTPSVNNVTVEEGSPTVTGNIALTAAGGTIDVASGSTFSIVGILSGSATINKNGAGTFVTGGTATNTQSGAVNVNAGVFEIQKSGFVGAITNTSAVTVAAGATLRFNGDSGYTQETMGSLAGAGTVTNVGAAVVNMITGDTTSTTFSGTITNGTNALNLQKAGTGTLTLSGANSYTGTTSVTAGILNVQNNAALGTTAGGTSVSSGATLQLQGNITVGAEALTLSGTGATGQNGALVNVSGTNSYGGLVTLGAATTIASNAGTLNLTNTGTITGSGFGLTLAGAGNGTLSSVIGTGTGGLTKTGAGNWTLSGASTYTGTTTISAGTLTVGVTNALPTGTAVSIASGATLDVNGFTQTVGSVAGNGNISLGTGKLTAGGNNSSTTFGGTLAGTGTFVKTGTGTLTLTQNQTFAGTLELAAGTLQLNNTTLNLGTLNVTGSSTIDFAGTASTLSLTNLTIAAGATLTILNWQNAVDFLYTSNWTGAAFDTSGVAPMSQILFSGVTGNTKWQGYDHQITPVPESSTYGGLLLLGLLAAGWRTHRARAGS